MAGLLYLQYALFNLILLVWAVQLYRSRAGITVALAGLLAAGLLYDNLVLALGALLAVGPLLFTLNWLRYLLQVLIAPLFVPLFIELARRSGVGRLAARRARLLAAAVVLSLVGYGALELANLSLAPLVSGGAVRYVALAPGPPVIGPAAILAGLVAGAAIWRVRGWPWLCLAALAALLGSAAAVALGRDALCLVTNGVEIVLLAAALACERYLRAEPVVRTTPAPVGR